MNTPESINNFELPSVSNEAIANDGLHEAPVSVPEKYTQPSAPVATTQQSTVSPVDLAPVTNAGSPTDAVSFSQPAPVIADDNDLTEKEWVVKAKQIVAATKEDPYKQNQEISKFRADYIKKRYNKNIKIEGA